MMTSRPDRQTTLGKLSPPRLGRVIGRDRLFAEIEQYSAAPGLWIAGPPGIGKTVLVATYLDTHSLLCLWLQLDAADIDPATFVLFLRVAAKRLAPRRRMRVLLPSADDLRDVPGFIRRCFRRRSTDPGFWYSTTFRNSARRRSCTLASPPRSPSYLSTRA